MISRLLRLLFLLAMVVALGACSEEQYGSLYCPGPADTLVVHARTEIRQVSIIGDESGMAGMESLYLGAEGETESDILLEFDFGSILGGHPDYPDSLFGADSIKSARLTMDRLIPYTVVNDTTIPASLIYMVIQLEEGFNSEDYVVPPGPQPPLTGRILNSDFNQPNSSSEPRLRLYQEDVVDWISNREKVSMVVTAAAGSDSGLVGFASMELDNYELLLPLAVGSIPAPAIMIEFEDASIPNFLLPPVSDTSTFSQLESMPPGLAHLQTGMRSYPVFTFDIPPLPAGACTTVEYGFRLYASEIDPLMAGQAAGLVSLEPTAFAGWESPMLASTIQESVIEPSFVAYPDSTTPEGATLFQEPIRYRLAPVPPEEMHLILGFSDYAVGIVGRYGSYSDILFSQSAFHAPGEPVDLQPTLFVYYRLGAQ